MTKDKSEKWISVIPPLLRDSHTQDSLSAIFMQKNNKKKKEKKTTIFSGTAPAPPKPTFIPVIGTDSQYSEAHVCILVHVDLIGRLWKHWLVVVYIADEDSNVCRVWKKIDGKRRSREQSWETRRTLGIVSTMLAYCVCVCVCIYSTSCKQA